MSEHLTSEERSAFLQGRLPARRVLAVVEHLESCPSCSASARRSDDPAARASAGLASQFPADLEEHPAVETVLTEYVDGTLAQTEVGTVEEHLALCARCREDVEDLRATARAMSRPARRSWIPAAVAAAVILALLATLLFLRREPAPPRVVDTTTTATTTTQPPQSPAPPREERYARAEWRTAVDEALKTGALQMPASLATLQLSPDVLREGRAAEEAARLEPVRTIVETTRPRFTWTPSPGATYLVSVFEDEALIAQSDVLLEPQWTPPRDLRRGRVYQWEVEVRSGDDARILPAPPAPPALFRVLDEAAHAELESARAQHGEDPLLLGVLYARHGLREDAARELRRVPTESGQRLLQSIEQWPQ